MAHSKEPLYINIVIATLILGPWSVAVTVPMCHCTRGNSNICR